MDKKVLTTFLFSLKPSWSHSEPGFTVKTTPPLLHSLKESLLFPVGSRVSFIFYRGGVNLCVGVVFKVNVC